MANEQVERLQRVTNEMADVLKDLRSKMEGRGISPAESPLVQSKLRQVEERLRQLGSNGLRLVPDDTPIRTLAVDAIRTR